MSGAARAVLMVRPAAFAANPETAGSNRFQQAGGGAAVAAAARAEVEAAARQLADAGVEVHVVDDTPVPPKPDACFPNNWFSTHADGTLVLYPMLAPTRRRERRLELIEELCRRGGFAVRGLVDLSFHEAAGRFLEGTGSLVLDRVARVAYACLSPRTDAAVLAEACAELGLRAHAFTAVDAAGQPVYHTNVVMSVGPHLAVVCAEAVPGAAERHALLGALEAAGHRPLEISLAQLHAFAGNVLELAGCSGPVVAVSATAWAALGPSQRRRIETAGQPVIAAVPTIERHGGGSIRCMLAEVFLPRAAA